MKDILNIALRLALVCAVAALLLAQVDGITRDPIAAAVRMAKLEAVKAVMPPCDNAPDESVLELPGPGGEAIEYFVGRQADAFSGAAFKAVTQRGYSGEIELILGVDAQGKVTGVRVLRHAETPGLGAKYAAPEVLDAFYGGRDLAGTRWRVSKDGGDLDAVTGATVTGRALAGAIEAGLQGFARNRERLAAPPDSSASAAASAAAPAAAPLEAPAAVEEVRP